MIAVPPQTGLAPLYAPTARFVIAPTRVQATACAW